MRSYKPRPLSEEKERVRKQIEKAETKLAKLEAMTPEAWADYQKNKAARQEVWNKMSDAQRKEYNKRKRAIKKQADALPLDQRDAFYKRHTKELLPGDDTEPL